MPATYRLPARNDTVASTIPVMTEEALISSPLLSPYILLCVRLAFMVFFIIGCHYTYIDDRENPIHIANTLSFQSMLGNTIYFGLITLFTVFRYKKLSDLSLSRYDALAEHRTLTFSFTNYRQWIPYLIYLMWDILTPVAFLVTIVYWAFIHSSAKFPSIAMHIINSVAFGFELIVARVLTRKRHLILLLLLGGAFLLHMYLYYENSGLFIYKPFDYETKPSNIAIWPGSIVFITLLFFTVWGITRGKSKKIDDFCVYQPIPAPEATYKNVQMTNMV